MVPFSSPTPIRPTTPATAFKPSTRSCTVSTATGRMWLLRLVSQGGTVADGGVDDRRCADDAPMASKCAFQRTCSGRGGEARSAVPGTGSTRLPDVTFSLRDPGRYYDGDVGPHHHGVRSDVART